MGVHGLWRLLDATGKPVALETLEGKILAVDVSIWLHQVMQGYQDGRGNPLPNAHLLGLFNRICKLLYYKIKPVFVFDGGVPLLKKNTIASRRKQKSVAASKAQRMKNDLINNLLKRTVVKGALGGGGNTAEKQIENGQSSATASQAENRSIHSSLDLFKLPAIADDNQLLSEEEDDPDSDSDSSIQLSPRKQAKWIGNIHSVDVSSAEFRALPPDVRHDILTDLKATRKQNSWGRLHEIPQESHDFSNYQMKRLLKRRNVQECLEQAEKEMGGKTMTLEELDILLTEQGIDTTTREKTSRIAGDNSTRFVYINGLKKDATSSKDEKVTAGSSRTELEDKDDSSEDEDVKIIENLREYQLEDDWESDWESGDEQEVTVVKSKEFKKLIKASDVNPAMAYMLEHSGLSQEEILCIIEQSKKKSRESQNSEPGSSLDTKIRDNSKFLLIKDEDSVEQVTGIVETAENTQSSRPSDVSVKSENSEGDLIIEDKDSSSKKSDDVEILGNEMMKNEESDSGAEETPVATISESESDDFVEVEDVPLSIATSFTRQTKPMLEIAIVPELPLEEDMFADVFSNGETSTEIKPPAAVEKPIEAEVEAKECEISNNVADKTESSSSPAKESNISKSVAEESSVQNADEAEELLKEEDKGDLLNQIEETDIPEEPEEPEVGVEANDELKDLTKEKDVMKFPVRREELLTMQEQLENEEKELTGNLGRLERQATDITDQMRLEAQELLRLFGIPYIIAPMEAEAQCAYLEMINLTEGTITDDSDIWLFGGRCVYKNFFNLNKHVLQFRSTDIRHHFNLSREQMIQLALLVGSDYTIGVSGIGPVTALEILGAFPAEEGNLLRGLTNFRYWVHSGRAAGPGRTTLRTKLKNIHVEKGFPSEAVAQAYLAPAVDESREAFTWNKPNAILLGDFAREKFGWTKNKFEVIFNPIVKRQTEPRKQKGIDCYFDVKVSQKSIEGNLSKRVQKAVQRLGDDTPDSETPEKHGRKNKRKLEAVVEEGDDVVPRQTPSVIDKDSKVAEVIPQREKDKANSLKKKLHAIEVFRKSKKGPGHAKKTKRSACKIKEKAELSESSDSS